MSIRGRIQKFQREWAAAGERVDELNAKKSKPASPRHLTDEQTTIMANAATAASTDTVINNS